MIKYEKPVLSIIDDSAENIYMASGDGGGNCWNVSGEPVQSWDGSSKVFEIRASHSREVEHISTGVNYVITFSAPLATARSEFSCSVSGNKVYVNRESHANGYKSGDTVTFKVWASTGDQATTEALAITGITWSCSHATNVQGKYD